MATKISKGSTRKSPGKKPATHASRIQSAGRRIEGKTASVKAKTVASQLPLASAAKTAAAKKKFEQGIIARGEAVQAGSPLPRRSDSRNRGQGTRRLADPQAQAILDDVADSGGSASTALQPVGQAILPRHIGGAAVDARCGRLWPDLHPVEASYDFHFKSELHHPQPTRTCLRGKKVRLVEPMKKRCTGTM